MDSQFKENEASWIRQAACHLLDYGASFDIDATLGQLFEFAPMHGDQQVHEAVTVTRAMINAARKDAHSLRSVVQVST